MLRYQIFSAYFHIFVKRRLVLIQLISTTLLTVLFTSSVMAQNMLDNSGVLQAEADQAAKFYQNGEVSNV
jgi:hypothetical protein